MTSLWVRRGAIALGGLALALVVAAAVLLASFDANRYKSRAAEWMKTEHQRGLVIEGPIELSFFPRLAVKISKLRLSERGSDAEFVAIDEAALAVRVWPLLRKQWVIDRVNARGVRASYLRDAGGVRNVDDLLSGLKTPDASAGTSTPDATPVRFDVSAIQFDDLRLHVNDETAKLAGDIAVLMFTSGRLANQVESPVSLRATMGLTRPQAMRLALDGRLTLVLDLDRNAVAATDMKLQIEGDAADVQALSLALEGALAWDGSALRAGPLQVALKAATVGPTALAPSTLGIKRGLLNTRDKRLELEALKLAVAGRRGDSPFQLSLDWPQLGVDPHRIAGSALSGRIKVGGPTVLDGEFRSAAPTGNFDALRVPGLELRLAGSSGQRKIDAVLQADTVLDLGHPAATIERLDMDATLAEPGLQPLKLNLQGTGRAAVASAIWRLNGSLDANRFDAAGEADFAAAVPSIKASARFDALDLNALLAPGRPATPVKGAAAPADTPVQLDGLKTANGQFDVAAGMLSFRQYKVADAKVVATLDNGSLRVSRLGGRAWGGTFEASGSADAGSRRVALKLDASGVSVDLLLRNVADKDLLEGTGRVVGDLHSSGTSLDALRSNLGGTAAVQLRDGAIKGINLARSLRQAQAALSLKQDAITQASSVEKTDFSELRASARIANGVAQSDDLDLKSPFLRIRGAGRFDIGRGRIDYIARASVTDSAVGQGGAGLEALRGVTVPIALSGPFDAIDWKIQWSEVAAAAVQNRLKDTLTDALGAKLGVPSGQAGAASGPGTPKDALKDALKGLLK